MARTYGSLILAEGSWHVHAEPHVMIRLKRLFPRVQQNLGIVTIRDSDEVSRDLVWFAERYPLNIDPEHRAHLVRRSKVFDERNDTFAGILSGKLDAKAFELAVPPRDYQRVAADLALRVHGLLLADDLGIGKTCSAICMLTDPRTRPALVVTMTHLPKQWQREIAKFAPNLTTHIIKKGTPYDIVNPKPKKGQLSLIEPEFPDVLIINYHKLAGWRDVLAGVMRSVIFDEVQELRHSDSNKALAAAHIAEGAAYRLGLSATPIYNYGSEFYNVISVLRPDALGTQQEFIREWCSGRIDQSGRARIADPKAFGAYVREAGVMIRRTRGDVGRELPALSKVPHHVDADPKALDKVKDSVATLAKFILQRQGTTFDRMKAGGELDWKMRQATGIAKAPYVAEFVRMLVESGEKVLLYGWHHAVYGIWAERLKQYAKIVHYTGEESPTQKEKARTEFIEGDAQVLIMSLRAGQGLDGLQAVCRTVIFGELDWSPGVHEQCVGRIFRDGQKDPVVAYFLVSDEGSDPVVADVLGLKKAQIEGVRDPEADLFEKLEAPEHGIRRLAESVLRSRGIDPALIKEVDKAMSADNMGGPVAVAEADEGGG